MVYFVLKSFVLKTIFQEKKKTVKNMYSGSLGYFKL